MMFYLHQNPFTMLAYRQQAHQRGTTAQEDGYNAVHTGGSYIPTSVICA